MLKKFVLIATVIVFLSTLVLGAALPERASAQVSLKPWDTPINLSRSGSTNSPFMIIDKGGNPYAFWYDDEAGFLYRRQVDGEWSQPAETYFPFGRSDPFSLIADSRGYLYAFWIGNKDELIYSYVPLIGFDKKNLWSIERVIGQDVARFQVVKDADESLHLAYIRNSEENNQPAGVYYRKSRGAGSPWATARMLYESRYFRSLDNKTAHLSLAATTVEGVSTVFVAWDHPALKQLLLSKSVDGGDQWDTPIVLDGPTDIAPDAAPFNIIIHAYGSNVILLWETGLQSGVDCTQVSQISRDLGATWGDRQISFAEVPGCPTDQKLFVVNDYPLLMANIQDEVYLSAWNNTEWSVPQLQSPLNIFNDPDVFNTVIFRCHQTALIQNRLFVLGCDSEGDGDIWLLTRPLGEISEWFGQSVFWEAPKKLTEGQSNIHSPAIICEPSGIEHVIWSQTLTTSNELSDTAIYYSKLDASGWVGPSRILNTREAKAAEPSLTIDQEGRLLSSWIDSAAGSVFFSLAQSEMAHNSFNWAAAIPLPVLEPAAGSPVVLSSNSGRILVAYAIRLNEERGIYLTISDDDGRSWSQPLKVFDAVANGWYGIDQPRLAQTNDGSLHLIWTRRPLAVDDDATALYYARSSDDGITWSQPQLVIEEPLSMGFILAVGDQTVHLFWLSQGSIPGIWHEYSIDSGKTWGPSDNLSGLGEAPGLASVIPDREGRLHLVQAVRNELEGSGIKYSVWNGAVWSTVDTFHPDDGKTHLIESVGACLDMNDRLSVVYSTTPNESLDIHLNNSLNYTERRVESPPLEAANVIFNPPLEVVTVTPEAGSPTLAITPTETIPPTDVIQPPAETLPPGASGQSQPPGILGGQSWIGIALGLGLAFIIVVVAVSLALRRRRHGYYG